MKTYDCEPTLTDGQVLDFCKNGFLMLKGVVPDEINRRTLDFVEPRGDDIEPLELLQEAWFVDNVIRNPQAAGAVRSLLGKDLSLPILISNHRAVCPMSAQEWHRDGGSMYGPAVNYLQVFYYPQDCPLEMGPTELLPGSHFLFSMSSHMGHYGRIKGSYYATAPAGSIFLTVYSIWHRRSESTGSGVRFNLKYNYWRNAEPSRDWVIEPGFSLVDADYTLPGPRLRQQFRDTYDAAEMLLWLRGEHDRFAVMGGQGWPMPGNRDSRPFGVPAGLE